MIEMALLEQSRETDKKVRWDADVDGTRFSLYIPKWRVPEPWPRLIDVTVGPRAQEKPDTLSPTDACHAPESRNKPIVAHLKKYAECTQTIRYRPEGDSEGWEIGEPYIPTPMTFGGAERLTIEVKWQRGAQSNS